MLDDRGEDFPMHDAIDAIGWKFFGSEGHDWIWG